MFGQRGGTRHTFRVGPRGEVMAFGGEVLRESLGVRGLIRMEAREFDRVCAGEQFWHLSVGRASHMPGQSYALARIIRPRSAPGSMSLPLLDGVGGLREATVLEVQTFDFEKAQLRDMPRHARLEDAVNMLTASLLRRCGAVRKLLIESRIMEMEISATLVEPGAIIDHIRSRCSMPASSAQFPHLSAADDHVSLFGEHLDTGLLADLVCGRAR